MPYYYGDFNQKSRLFFTVLLASVRSETLSQLLIIVFYNKTRSYRVTYTKNRMQNDGIAIDRSIVKPDQIPTIFGQF